MTAEKGDRRIQEPVEQLVQIGSSDPGVYESQAEQWVYEWFTKEIEEKTGALRDQIELVQREVMPSRFNLMARIPEKEQAPTPAPVYICHTGTMMPGEGWEEEALALGVVVKKNRLYGKGVYDMKSGLAYAMSALSDMVELTGNTGGLPARPFVFIGTADKEDFIRGVESATRDGWVDKGDRILDTEPTDGQIQVAHKGRAWFELTIQEITAHASNPWKGAGAIATMTKVVSHTRKAIGSCPFHKDLGMSTVTFGQITGGYRLYVVSDSYKAWVDMCLVPPMNITAARNIVKEAVRTAEAKVVGVRDSCLIIGDRPYVEKDSSSRFLASPKSVCDRVTGEDTSTGSLNDYTDTVVIAGTLGNCNCISYGPGNSKLAHKPNECVPYEDMCRCRCILTELARQEAFFPFAF